MLAAIPESLGYHSLGLSSGSRVLPFRSGDSGSAVGEPLEPSAETARALSFGSLKNYNSYKY